ncbi:hypothetical protein [Paenibacillus sp. A3]|uniref:hypothetical protein n=1 Tax=Paenibacillus sp. A3 TaxID=1337054 RepID=UPI000AB33CBA|nr:hypothetical protein [Paenibacillus sp. A3]
MLQQVRGFVSVPVVNNIHAIKKDLQDFVLSVFFIYKGAPMKKVFIVGIVASGKTTLAKRLSQKLNVPWYELDGIVHPQTEAGRYKRTADEQVEVIREIDKSGAWIFEGTDQHKVIRLYDNRDLSFVK